MKILPEIIFSYNQAAIKTHRRKLDATRLQMDDGNLDIDGVIASIQRFQVALPSWALGAGGTRFGRWAIGGEPRSLEEKIEDIGLLAALTKSTDAVSLHIPWDIPDDVQALRHIATENEIHFDAVNSNTFQDHGQALTYRMGSLSHVDGALRDQAVAHHLDVIRIGELLGSKGLTIWLADGSNFPGQTHFRRSLGHTEESLRQIYAALPLDWKLLLEYKPYEPNFYSTVIPDWGTSFLLCRKVGPRAKVLVDLGHHLPNTNIEQVVATLLREEILAGFHFNDSKYGDDDLTTGSIKPYQLFLIFLELVTGTAEGFQAWDSISWMIDASHNIKDPLEDLIQALEAIRIAYAKALLVDRESLERYQLAVDVTQAQECLQRAFLTDVRPLVAEARLRSGGALEPLQVFRELGVRGSLIQNRGSASRASGL